MRVLGVSVVELADTTLASQAVRTALAERVVRPCNMLVEDLGAGARPSTAFWLLHRFVIPNAVFYAQIWGLLTGADVWTEVDAALDALCRTLAPADLRRRFDDSDTHALRRELALPQRLGGLGIPIFSTAFEPSRMKRTLGTTRTTRDSIHSSSPSQALYLKTALAPSRRSRGRQSE